MEKTQAFVAVKSRRATRFNLSNLLSFLLRRSSDKPTKKLIVTDADGTLWSFWDYFVPAMQEVIPIITARINARTGRNFLLDDVSGELGRVVDLRKTHEWPWLLEESRFWQDKTLAIAWSNYAEFCEEIVVPFWTILDQHRIRNLRLFEDVIETLHTLRRAGIKVVILSDANDYMARTRVLQMNVSEFLAGVYCLETPLAPPDLILNEAEIAFGLERVRRLNSVQLNCPVRSLPEAWEKPDRNGLALIMSEFAVTPDEVLFVGDSLRKDGGAANANRVNFLWARYGVHLPTEYKRMIDVKFVPAGAVSHIAKPKIYPPMLDQIASWSELLNHLGPEPLPLLPTVLHPSASPDAVKRAGH